MILCDVMTVSANSTLVNILEHGTPSNRRFDLLQLIHCQVYLNKKRNIKTKSTLQND